MFKQRAYTYDRGINDNNQEQKHEKIAYRVLISECIKLNGSKILFNDRIHGLLRIL